MDSTRNLLRQMFDAAIASAQPALRLPLRETRACLSRSSATALKGRRATSAGRLNRFSPDGRLIQHVKLPILHPTMPCLGSPDGRTLYVTSHRENYTPETLARTPLAGGVFMLEPGVAGAPAASCQG